MASAKATWSATTTISKILDVFMSVALSTGYLKTDQRRNDRHETENVSTYRFRTRKSSE